MPTIYLDQREVEAAPGSSILEAARAAGITIPTLCHVPELPASGSCMVCAVRVNGSPWLVPACATKVEDGMRIEVDSAAVHKARKQALELLLSEHLGDCIGPCETVCAVNMNIPLMIRQIRAGDLRGAVATVKARIAMPATTGRICPAPCEKVCRRGFLPFPGAGGEMAPMMDQPLSIARLERYVADADLASAEPYQPPCKPPNGHRIAIVGAGPAGLAAAYYLQQWGYACTVLDEQAHAGGMLRHGPDPETLPPAVIDAEVAQIRALGVDLRMNCRVGREVSMADLRAGHAAVILAVGKLDPARPQALDVPVAKHGIGADRHTMMTSVSGVFACGDAIRPHHMAIRALAEGRAAAISVDQWLSGRDVTGPPRVFNVHIGKPSLEEAPRMIAQAAATGAPRGTKAEPAVDLVPDTAMDESTRCLRCDCRKRDACRLRDASEELGAHPRAFKVDRKPYTVEHSHAEIVFEAGKCIACGNCVGITQRAGEELGLAFRGRGFSVEVTVPFDEAMTDGLRKTARACVEACPTAALSFRDRAMRDAPGEAADA